MSTLAAGGNFQIVYTVFLFVVGAMFVIDFPVKKPHGIMMGVLLVIDIAIFVSLFFVGGMIG